MSYSCWKSLNLHDICYTLVSYDNWLRHYFAYLQSDAIWMYHWPISGRRLLSVPIALGFLYLPYYTGTWLHLLFVIDLRIRACDCNWSLRFLWGSEFKINSTKNRSVCENAVTGIWGSCRLLVMGSCFDHWNQPFCQDFITPQVNTAEQWVHELKESDRMEMAYQWCMQMKSNIWPKRI